MHRRMKKAMKKGNQEPFEPEHLKAEPQVTAKFCKNCGGRHSAGRIECPIVQYQTRSEVRNYKFWLVYPCHYCSAKEHTTTVCPELHAYCSNCSVRGHTPGVKCNETKQEKYTKFLRYRHFGIRTGECSRDDEKWGFQPSKDIPSVGLTIERCVSHQPRSNAVLK